MVEANLDDRESLVTAFTGISAVYYHATAGDSSKADPLEVERAKRIAQVAKQANIKHFVYNSAGGADRNSGIGHIEQKYQIEQILKQAGLPTTMLRACLFMEEFWKKYTRPSILKGSFPFSVQPNKPLHLITTKDLGRVAAYVMKHPEKYIGKEEVYSVPALGAKVEQAAAAESDIATVWQELKNTASQPLIVQNLGKIAQQNNAPVNNQTNNFNNF